MRKAASLGPGGSLSATMTVGQTTDGSSYWVRGFVATASNELAEVGSTVGSMSGTTIGSATAVGIYWRGLISSAGNGRLWVEITGNWPAGSLSSLTVDAVSQGSFGAPTYNSGTNTTSFIVGGLMVNPLGTSGTKAIVLS